ncbi:tetratricopeptide repeat protein, partial [Gallaecimonas xiamenensis]
PWWLVPAALVLLGLGWWLGHKGLAKAAPQASIPVVPARPAAATGPEPYQAAGAEVVAPAPAETAPAAKDAIEPLGAAEQLAPQVLAKAVQPAETMPAATAPETALPRAALPKAALPKAVLPEAAPAKVAAPPAPQVARRILSPQAQADQHYQEGLLAFQQQQLLEAEGQWRQALELAPDKARVRLALAQLYEQQQQPDQALAVLAPLADLDPAVSLASAQLLVRQQQLDAAYGQLQRLTPASREGQQLKAELARLTGHLAEAEAQYQALLGQFPGDGRLWLALGLTLDAKGQPAQAAQAFGHAAQAPELSAEARQYALARQQSLGAAQ